MPQLNWKKSSFSEGGSENCVELAAALTGTRRHLRESDNPAAVVTTSPTALRALILSIKAGEFNGSATD